MPCLQQPHRFAGSGLPHCGFKLLGSTQRFEPVSFGDDALPVAAAPQAAAALHVVRGPQTGVTYQLGDQALTMGAARSATCSSTI